MIIEIDNIVLRNFIENGNFLFHITNEKGMNSILKEGKVRPLTYSGCRSLYGVEEKKTASFTSNPIDNLEDMCAEVGFEGKNIVMVFKREPLIGEGVYPVKYVPNEVFKKNLDNYKLGNDIYEDELEWRSLEEVDIRDSFIAICRYVRSY